MITQYFLKPQTQDRIRACWLGEAIEGYVTWLHAQRYAARNVYRRVRVDSWEKLTEGDLSFGSADSS